MGEYDTMQVCLNGHTITDRYVRHPEDRKDFCDRCGASTITSCEHCKTSILGKYYMKRALVVSGYLTPVPKHCRGCGKLFPWTIKKIEEKKAEATAQAEIYEKKSLLSEKQKFEFDAAFSLAGEDRKIVEEIADESKKRGFKIFYDKFYKAELWGKDLSDYFQKTYSKKSRFVIIFISKNYQIKDWTNFEFSIAKDEAKQRTREFILPIRLDDTKIVGIKDTIGIIDYKKEGKENVINLIEKKLKEPN